MLTGALVLATHKALSLKNSRCPVNNTQTNTDFSDVGLKPRKVSWLAQGHTAIKCWGQDAQPGLPDSRCLSAPHWPLPELTAGILSLDD